MAQSNSSLSDVPLPVWRELLAAAVDFKAARLWERWSDGHNFALVDEQMRPWFVSVLGAAGQVFGLVLYRGESGLRFLLNDVHELERLGRDVMYLQDALMLDWGSKKFLKPEEVALLTRLGHAPKPRERAAWPSFRTHNPGLVPWTLNEVEARELTRGVRATLAAFALAGKTPDFFAPCEQSETLLPTVMVSDALGGTLRANQVQWRHWQVPPQPRPEAPQPSAEWLARHRELPLAPGRGLELDIFHFASAVAEGGRPFYPLTGLAVDDQTGFVLGIDMAQRGEAWGDLVLSLLAKALTTARYRPQTIAIKREAWLPVLEPVIAALGIQLILDEELPQVTEARESLAHFTG